MYIMSNRTGRPLAWHLGHSPTASGRPGVAARLWSPSPATNSICSARKKEIYSASPHQTRVGRCALGSREDNSINVLDLQASPLPPVFPCLLEGPPPLHSMIDPFPPSLCPPAPDRMLRRATLISTRHIARAPWATSRPRQSLFPPRIAALVASKSDMAAGQGQQPQPQAQTEGKNMGVVPLDDVHAMPHHFHHLSNELLFHLVRTD